jgi:chromosome partitioning protein
MKGGVGKTTLCVNIAHALSTKYKKRVLIIDMDPQFNASQYILRVIYGEKHVDKYDELKKQKKTIFYLYEEAKRSSSSGEEPMKSMFNKRHIEDNSLKKELIFKVSKNLDIILGDIDLIELQIKQQSGIETKLSRYIDVNNLKEKYDYIFIDSPPTYSFFFISSYLCCDTYIVPVKPDYLSSNGISLLSRAEESIYQTYQKIVEPMGIVFTLIDPRNHLHIPVQKNIIKSIGGKNVFNNNMRYLKAIPEGLNKQQFMIDINEQDISSEITKITAEFIARLTNR